MYLYFFHFLLNKEDYTQRMKSRKLKHCYKTSRENGNRWILRSSLERRHCQKFPLLCTYFILEVLKLIACHLWLLPHKVFTLMTSWHITKSSQSRFKKNPCALCVGCDRPLLKADGDKASPSSFNRKCTTILRSNQSLLSLTGRGMGGLWWKHYNCVKMYCVCLCFTILF